MTNKKVFWTGVIAILMLSLTVASASADESYLATPFAVNIQSNPGGTNVANSYDDNYGTYMGGNTGCSFPSSCDEHLIVQYTYNATIGITDAIWQLTHSNTLDPDHRQNFTLPNECLVSGENVSVQLDYYIKTNPNGGYVRMNCYNYTSSSYDALMGDAVPDVGDVSDAEGNYPIMEEDLFVTYTVASPTIPNITDFSTTNDTIQNGDSTQLDFTVTDATDLDLGGTNVTGLTAYNVSPASTTVYTLTATNENGTVNANLTINVYTIDPVIYNYAADNDTILNFTSTTLRWIVGNQTDLDLNGVNVTDIGYHNPQSFTLARTDAGGSTGGYGTWVNVTEPIFLETVTSGSTTSSSYIPTILYENGTVLATLPATNGLTHDFNVQLEAGVYKILMDYQVVGNIRYSIWTNDIPACNMSGYGNGIVQVVGGQSAVGENYCWLSSVGGRPYAIQSLTYSEIERNYTVSPTSTTVYTLTATNQDGTVNDNLTVTVNSLCTQFDGNIESGSYDLKTEFCDISANQTISDNTTIYNGTLTGQAMYYTTASNATLENLTVNVSILAEDSNLVVQNNELNVKPYLTNTNITASGNTIGYYTINDAVTGSVNPVESSTVDATVHIDYSITGDSSAYATCTYDVPGIGTVTNMSSSLNCTGVLPVVYYESPGNYDANVTLTDDFGSYSEIESSAVTINVLLAIQKSQSYISFTGDLVGEVNVSSNTPITIQNTGNANVTNISVTGYDLTGTTSPAFTLPATAFRAGETLGTSQQLADGVQKTFVYSLGTGVNETVEFDLWLTMPAGQYQQGYRTITPWTIVLG